MDFIVVPPRGLFRSGLTPWYCQNRTCFSRTILVSVHLWADYINFSTKFYGSLTVRFCISLTKVWNRQLLAGPPAEKAPISGLGNSWRRATIFPQPTGCGSRPALPVPEFYWALLTVHSPDQKGLKSVGIFSYILTIAANKKVLKLFILVSALKKFINLPWKNILEI